VVVKDDVSEKEKKDTIIHLTDIRNIALRETDGALARGRGPELSNSATRWYGAYLPLPFSFRFSRSRSMLARMQRPYMVVGGKRIASGDVPHDDRQRRETRRA